ncbi:recombinase family protein [Micrococcus luteus]|uniref:recombinase family protein n=1 Tax=Micrococcus luteus TaxID=1270 RepID=UPI00147A577E|nr:recombinase family protein [Micrococcus luteus]NNM37191.1 recombinase family protein [Micrococcus luteus]
MKAVIYARVSRDRRQQERSVSEQEAECRAFVAAQGWEVAAVHVDNDRSASRYSRKDRPAWDVLMGELSRYDVLVTWEASRATRNLEVYAELRRRCRDEGVLWAYSGRVYDLSRSDDAFMTGLEMLTAERSSDDTAKRIQRTVRSQAKAGRPHGRIPFGYAREYDPTTGALVRQVPHETEAPLIREMTRRVLDGESLYSISKDLSQRNVPRMRLNPWDTVRIKRVLTNPTIAGKRVYRGEVIGNADWEGIITPEEFEALKGVFSAPRYQALSHHGSEPRHLLSGVARCGVCGSKMKRVPASGRNAARYECSTHHTAIRQTWADDLVNAVMVARLRQPDALEVSNRPAGEGVVDLARELRTLEQRLEGIYAEAAAGELSARGLTTVEARILADMDEKRAQIARAATPTVPTIADPGALADGWAEADMLLKRSIVAALVNVAVHPTRKPGSKVFDPERIRITWKGSDDD